MRELLGHDSEPAAGVLSRHDSAASEEFGPHRATRRIGAGGMGEVYLVLEYVEGRHIDVFCREQALGLRARLELFIKVLKAVQYAHDRGVVHRDLKPSNILVRADGEPRLLDFGIARAVADEADDTARLTGTGQRLFTPEFASPEQVRGDPVGPVSDLFSVGLILYQLLGDAGPWEGSGTSHELERRILDADPLPPSRRQTGTARRSLSGDLDTIVLGCLAKDPALWVATQARLLIVATACHRITSTPEVASQAADEAYAYTLEWLEPGHSSRLEAMNEYAGQPGSRLGLEERLAILEAALDEAHGAADPHDANIGSLQVLRDRFLAMEGRQAEALECFDAALEVTRWHLGEGHGDADGPQPPGADARGPGRGRGLTRATRPVLVKVLVPRAPAPPQARRSLSRCLRE